MGSLGLPEIAFILVLALLIFGPKRLPQIGRTLGKGMAEFRKASTELQRAIHVELDEPSSPPATRRPALLPNESVIAEAQPAVTAHAPAPGAETAAPTD